MERLVHIGVYRILRRFGAQREEINPNSKLADLFEIDEIEWNCFMFFLESKFNISISKEEELQLVTVRNVIEAVTNRLNPAPRMYSRKYDYAAEVA